MRLAACLLLFAFLLDAHAPAGIAEYSERGKIDFDTAIQLLNPYGTWSKIDGLWAYTPTDHETPYTSGRWLYTEYGWYWKGNAPYGWATDHYGYWKRGADGVWSWFPGATWLPQIVEIRATETHIGWRSAEVDSDGDFVEESADRSAKTDEWSFVTKAQFTRPITPAIVASAAIASKQLDDSGDSLHTYVTYRAITRPGPHPADFVGLAGDGGMFAPALDEGGSPSAEVVVPSLPVKFPAPKANSATVTAPGGLATNAAGSPTNAAPGIEDDNGAPADARQVNYWITMSLPTYWTPRPAFAQSNEIYLYRPDFFQDEDGIQRRISLWINPKSRTSLSDLRNVLTRGATPKEPVAPTGPGAPTVPVAPEATNPFRSPFDESFHGGSKNTSPSNAPSNAAPSGLSGSSTNAAPAASP